jgi:hypothetical protein
MSDKTVIDFDIDRYMRASKRLDLSAVDWDDLPNHALSHGDVMCVHYMMDIETHTVIYLRDLLGHPRGQRSARHRVPLVLGLRRAVARRGLLRVPAPLRDRGAGRAEAPRRLDADADAPAPGQGTAREARGGPPAPPPADDDRLDGDAPLHRAAHDVGSDQRADHPRSYYALIRRTPENPVLHQMLRRVIQDERRHFAFYRAQARARLERAPRRARRVVRWALENLWTPVGAGVKSQEEVDALAVYLFSDAEGRKQVRDIDRTVLELPGLDGLTLVEAALDGAVRRAAETPGYAGTAAKKKPVQRPELAAAAS